MSGSDGRITHALRRTDFPFGRPEPPPALTFRVQVGGRDVRPLEQHDALRVAIDNQSYCYTSHVSQPALIRIQQTHSSAMLLYSTLYDVSI